MSSTDGVRVPVPGETWYAVSFSGVERRCVPVVVERLTATQVVTTRGDRFRRKDLTQVGPVSQYSTTVRLHPADDPDVVKMLASEQVRRVLLACDPRLNPLPRLAKNQSAHLRTLARGLINAADALDKVYGPL